MTNRQQRRAAAAEQRKSEPGLGAAFQFTGDDLFVIFDGERIARRGRPGTPEAKTWVPLIPGFTVEDGEDLNSIAITYHDPQGPSSRSRPETSTSRSARSATSAAPRKTCLGGCGRANAPSAKRNRTWRGCTARSRRCARRSATPGETVTLLAAGGTPH